MVGFDPLANTWLWLRKKPIVGWQKSDIGKFSPDPQFASVATEQPKASFVAPAKPTTPTPASNSMITKVDMPQAPLTTPQMQSTTVAPTAPVQQPKSATFARPADAQNQAKDTTINLFLSQFANDIKAGMPREVIPQYYPELPVEVLADLYEDVKMWSKIEQLKPLYPELQNLNPLENIPVAMTTDDINPFAYAEKWANYLNEQAENINIPIIEPIAQWLASTVSFASKWLKDTTTALNSLEDKQIWAWNLYNRSNAEDTFDLVQGGINTAFAYYTPAMAVAFNSAIQWLPVKQQQQLWEVFSKGWEYITMIPWFKQLKASLPPDRQKELEQELFGAFVWLLLGTKGKANIIKNPMKFIQENGSLKAIMRNAQENVLNIPVRKGVKAIQWSTPIMQEWIKQAGKVIEWAKQMAWDMKEWAVGMVDKTTDYIAKKATQTVSDEDKLFKASSPRFNVLSRNKDIKSMKENSRIADEAVVNEWYKPTDTESRVQAHKNTMEAQWKRIEAKIQNKEDYMADLTPVIDDLEKYIAEVEKSWIAKNEWDINQLKREVKRMKAEPRVDIPTLESKKQFINWVINNRWDSKIWDVYKNGMKKATARIGDIMDEVISTLPWELKNDKRIFWALKATYEDIIKANIKAQRKKWDGIVETFSRIEWFADIIWGGVNLFSQWSKGFWQIVQGAGKVILGKSLAKATDPDFLITEWFKWLSQKKWKNIETWVKVWGSKWEAKYKTYTKSWLEQSKKKLDNRMLALPEKTTNNIWTPKNPIKAGYTPAKPTNKWVQAKSKQETATILSSKEFDKKWMTKIPAVWYGDQAPKVWDFTSKWKIVETTHSGWWAPQRRVKVEWDSNWTKASDIEIYRKQGLETKETPKLAQKQGGMVEKTAKVESKWLETKKGTTDEVMPRDMPQEAMPIKNRLQEIKNAKWWTPRKEMLNSIQSEYGFKIDDLSIEDTDKLAKALNGNTSAEKAMEIIEEIGGKYGKKFQKETSKPREWLSEAEISKTVAKYFKPDEISVIFREKITTPDWSNAFGAYHNKMIEFAKNPMKGTPEHEVVHAYIDLFKTNQQKLDILDHVLETRKLEVWATKKKYGITDDYLWAEEFLADWFIKYAQWKATFTGKLKTYFQDLWNDVKNVFGKEDKVRKLYQDITGKKRPEWLKKKPSKEMKRSEFGEKDEYTMQPILDIRKEVKWETVKKATLQQMVNRQGYKWPEKQALQSIIDNMEWDIMSKEGVIDQLKQEIMPLKIQKTAQYATYNKLFNTQDKPETIIYKAPFDTFNTWRWNHFDEKQYFSHVRLEWSPKNKALIELQSDLMQHKDRVLYNALKSAWLTPKEIRESYKWILTPKEVDFVEAKLKLREKDFADVAFKALERHLETDIEVAKINAIITNLLKIHQPSVKINSYKNEARMRRTFDETVKNLSKDWAETIKVPYWPTIAQIEWHSIPWAKVGVMLKDSYERFKKDLMKNEDFIYTNIEMIKDMNYDAWKDLTDIQAKKIFMDDIDARIEVMWVRKREDWQWADIIDPAILDDFMEQYYLEKTDYITMETDKKWSNDIKDNKAMIEKMPHKEQQTVARFYEDQLMPYVKKAYPWGKDVEYQWAWWHEIPIEQYKNKPMKVYQKEVWLPSNEVKLYRAWLLKDTRWTGIFLSDSAETAKSYESTWLGGKTTSEYTLKPWIKLYEATNRRDLMEELDSTFRRKQDDIAYWFVKKSQKNKWEWPTGAQMMQTYVEKRIKQELQKKWYEWVKYSWWVTDQAWEYQIFDSKNIIKSEWLPEKKYMKSTDREVFDKIQKHIDSALKLEWTRFDAWQKLAWIHDYLLDQYPQYKDVIDNKILETIVEKDIKYKKPADTFEMIQNKKAHQKRQNEMWDKYKWADNPQTLLNLTPTYDDVLDVNTIKSYIELWKDVSKNDIVKYYDKFYKRMSENANNVQLDWVIEDINRAVDHWFMPIENAQKYKNMIKYIRDSKWLPEKKYMKDTSAKLFTNEELDQLETLAKKYENDKNEFTNQLYYNNKYKSISTKAWDYKEKSWDKDAIDVIKKALNERWYFIPKKHNFDKHPIEDMNPFKVWKDKLWSKLDSLSQWMWKLKDPSDGVVYFHWTPEVNYKAILENWINVKSNKKWFAEDDSAFFVSNLSTASMYWDRIVAVVPKKWVKIWLWDYTNDGKEMLIYAPEKFEVMSMNDFLKEFDKNNKWLKPKSK